MALTYFFEADVLPVERRRDELVAADSWLGGSHCRVPANGTMTNRCRWQRGAVCGAV